MLLTKLQREDLFLEGKRFRVKFYPAGFWRVIWLGGPYISSPMKEHITPSLEEAIAFCQTYATLVLGGREASNG